MIQHFQGLWAYLQQVFAFVASPLVATFLFGLWSRRLGARAALRGLICGHVFSALFFIAREANWIHIHFTIIAGIVCAATALFTWGWMQVLGASDQPPADDARIALLARDGLKRVPRDVLAWAGVVLVLTAAIIIGFW